MPLQPTRTDLLSSRTSTIDTRTIGMIAVTENEIVMEAETVIVIASAEIGAGTRCAERMGTRS